MNPNHTGQGAPFDETLPATEPRIASPQPAPAGDWADVAATECAKFFHLWETDLGTPTLSQLRAGLAAIIRKHAPTQQQAEVGGEAGDSHAEFIANAADLPNLDLVELYQQFCARNVLHGTKLVHERMFLLRAEVIRRLASPRPESPEGDTVDLPLLCANCLPQVVQLIRGWKSDGALWSPHDEMVLNTVLFIQRHAESSVDGGPKRPKMGDIFKELEEVRNNFQWQKHCESGEFKAQQIPTKDYGYLADLLDRAMICLSALPAKGPGPGRSDTERLDWMEGSTRLEIFDTDCDGYIQMAYKYREMTIRQAIDSAMSPPPASQSNPREHKPSS